MKETICLVDLTIPSATDIGSLSCSVVKELVHFLNMYLFCLN